MTNEERKSEITKILQRDDFKNYCKNIIADVENFEYKFNTLLKICSIDVSDILKHKYVSSLQYAKNEKEAIEDTLDFYRWLDKLAPSDFCLESIVKKNLKYLEFDKYIEHSLCYHLASGKPKRKIIIETNDGIQTHNVIHEMCHSCQREFLELKKTNRPISEVATSICDELSLMFLGKKHSKKTTFLFVAREWMIEDEYLKRKSQLLDAITVKVMVGDLSLNEAIKKYGPLFKGQEFLIDNLIKKINDIKFSKLFLFFEHILGCAVSKEMKERFLVDPKRVASELKEILKHDLEWSEDELLSFLKLPPKDKLIENYVNKFLEREAKIRSEIEEEFERLKKTKTVPKRA